MTKTKVWRIRDSVHNLIEFDGIDPLESRLWQVMQTSAFQRLRRIKQLGFSDYVYPGATHTRFSHSLGVFHTARRLVGVIKKFENRNSVRYEEQHAAPALAAALLHDIGHGMFSHAFEKIGKENKWAMAKHEDVSQTLIRNGEVAEILNEYYDGFADNVAEVLKDNKDKQIPPNIFHAIVSSQFDADRLDYMQRDRLMTGVRSSYVDMEWLFANLEVGEVPIGQDEESLGMAQTLILGAKAQQTAENYVFSLFHLYPNIYLHKTTRGFEMLFQALMRRLISLIKEGKVTEIGLPEANPIVEFIREAMKPESIEKHMSEKPKTEILTLSQNLDDTVFWGSLPFLLQAKDNYIKKCAAAFRLRQPLRAIDIRVLVEAELSKKQWTNETDKTDALDRICEAVIAEIKRLYKDSNREVFCDSYSRPLYKGVQAEDKNSYLNQILIHRGSGKIADIRDISSAIRHGEAYHICRAYIFRDEREAENRRQIDSIIRESLKHEG